MTFHKVPELQSRNVLIIIALLFLYLSPSPLHVFRSDVQHMPITGHPSQKHTLPVNHVWSPEAAPSFCAPLMKSPALADSKCLRNQTTMQCKDGSYQMFSQMGQDFYLFTRHFAHLKRRGLYLDVATNNPIGISNTYFFEQCLGWSGLCVEANPIYLPMIHRFRECALVPTCVSDKDGRTVEFQLAAGLSGIIDTNKNNAAWQRENKPPPTMRQKCSTMQNEFVKYNISVVDYLSLDVEGHELHVLKGIDWDNIVINVLTIEAPEPVLPPIEEFMVSKGYIRHTPTLDERSIRTKKLIEDVIFLHKDVVWGKPV